MARPQKDVDLQKLKALMRMHPTLEDTAAFFEVSVDTIERVIKKNFKMRFAEFRKQNEVHTRFTAMRNLIKAMERGQSWAIIWYMKNQMGWKDKHEISGDSNSPITLAYRPKSEREK